MMKLGCRLCVSTCAKNERKVDSKKGIFMRRDPTVKSDTTEASVDYKGV